MSDRELIQAGTATVTASELVFDGVSYPLASIKSVVFFKEPLDVKGFLINVVVAGVGLYGISTLSTFGVIAGLVAVGICGFNLYGYQKEFKNPQWVVAVDFRSGKTIYIKIRNEMLARKLYEALNDSLRR